MTTVDNNGKKRTLSAMKILLHACCGPCSIYPVKDLRASGIDVVALFYNPNIHPFKEFERRVQAMEEVARILGFPVIFHPEAYGLMSWLDKVLSTAKERPRRCLACYEMRLRETAKKALEMGFDGFSSTLFYSVYQDHEAIKGIADQISAELHCPFLYRDFRAGWKEGQGEARRIGVYMQPYCGCIISEEERYEKRIKRMRKRFEEEET